MKCKDKCLVCKHSVVGDACNKDIEFKKCSIRDLSDRLIVYRLRLEYLNQDLEKSKLDSSADYYKKAIKETERIIQILNKEIFAETIKIKKH